LSTAQTEPVLQADAPTPDNFPEAQAVQTVAPAAPYLLATQAVHAAAAAVEE